MGKSKIQWTDETWNPVTGCTRVSAGCDNCYAAKMTKRLAAMGQDKYTGLINEGKNHFNGVIKCHDDTLEIPMKWQKPRMVFVNSMSDLFHPDVPFHFVAAVFGVMAYCKDQTFQVLTKRPDRMAEFFKWIKGLEMKTVDTGEVLDYDEPQKCVTMAIHKIRSKDIILMGMTNVKGRDWPLPNVWLGASVEDQQTANERIPLLLKVPATVRFLSMEPLLGPIDLPPVDAPSCDLCGGFLGGPGIHDCWDSKLGISWVIVGGESGHNARTMHAISTITLGGSRPLSLKMATWKRMAMERPCANPGGCTSMVNIFITSSPNYPMGQLGRWFSGAAGSENGDFLQSAAGKAGGSIPTKPITAFQFAKTVNGNNFNQNLVIK